jgi:hypothetical protein
MSPLKEAKATAQPLESERETAGVARPESLSEDDSGCHHKRIMLLSDDHISILT